MAFYIMSDNGASTGSIFEMDATISQNYNLAGKPTKYAVESGSKASDHYSKDLISLTYSGIVSDVKYLSGVEFSKNVADFESGIVALRDSGEFFACNFSDDQSLIKNCLFTSLQVSRSLENGKYAIAISFTTDQVEVANVSQVISATVPFETFKDPSEEKKKASGGTKTPEERETDLLDISLEFLSGGLLPREFRF
jgi:hypothetical protein